MNITTGLRSWIKSWMPLENLFPDTLPAFVRAPAYLFGVTSLSGLVLLILSGFLLAFFGPQWWHTNAVGRFVNSVHFWSTQVFFFAMAVHLWVEYSKGAWRHGRRLTWALGVISFVVGIGTAFTGYLSQTNFDAQWIAVQGKDAMNSIGIGAFFNLMNFGQMFGFHLILLPLAVSLLIAAHLVLVRIKGVVRPYAPTLPEERAREALWSRASRQETPGGSQPPGEGPLPSDQALYYKGLRFKPYDLVREGLLALGIVAVVALAFAAVFSSPDDPPLTIQSYAHDDPIGFLNTAIGELDGTSTIAQYGPPYNNMTGSVQYIGPVSLQTIFGVTIPIDTAQVYVIQPLSIQAETNSSLTSALAQFNSASDSQRRTWETAFSDALSKATATDGRVTIPAVQAGPVPTMMDNLLTLGQSGALDGLLLRTQGFYESDFTKPLLFLSEDALPTRAAQFNLLGTQWGAMNETGNYPGQAWLWLYTFWYQVPPFAGNPNADALVWVTMAFLTLLLIIYPYLPGFNRIPYYLRIHKLIWREYYEDVQKRKQ